MKHISIKILSENEFLNSEDEWAKLLKKSTQDPLFLGWNWQVNWWKQWSKKKGCKLYLLFAYIHNHDLVGIAPFYKIQFKLLPFLKINQIQFIGSSWGSEDTVRTEYLDFIIDKNYDQLVRAAFINHIYADKSWDQIVFSDINNNSATLKYILNNNILKKSYIRKVQSDVGIYIDTTIPFDSYKLNLGKNTRLKTFNKRSKLNKLGEVNVTYATIETYGEYLDHLNKFHEIRWGKPCFENESLDFHKQLSKILIENNCLHLSMLVIDDKPISVLYNIKIGEIEYNIQLGFDDRYNKAYSFGYLHLGYSIESAFNSKSTNEYDLLAGGGKNIFYKSHLSKLKYEFSTIQINRNHLLKALYITYDYLPPFCRRLIKNNRMFSSPSIINRNSVLILDAHSRAAIEAMQSLGKIGLNIEIASEEKCLANHSNYCNKSHIQPVDENDFINWIIELHQNNKFKLIVPSTEKSLKYLMKLDDKHEIKKASVIPSTNSLNIALDKYLTCEIALLLDMSVPNSRLINSLSDITKPLNYPLVLKPIESLVRFNNTHVTLIPIIVNNFSEWELNLKYLLNYCNVVEQEYVSGHGIGIELLYDNGEEIWNFQHERIHELPLTGGGSSYRRSVPVNKDLLAASKKLLNYLNWHGVAMVEFRGSEELGYKLMEINPRLWGSLALPIDAGVNFPKGLWQIANNQRPSNDIQYKHYYYTRNLQLDLIWMKNNFLADKNNPMLLTMPVSKSIFEYLRPIYGSESWDYFDIKDLKLFVIILTESVYKISRKVVKYSIEHLKIYFHTKRHCKVLKDVVNLNKAKPKNILFVCYGNICRSPLAMKHAKSIANRVNIKSTGFYEEINRCSPEWYQVMAKNYGHDLSTHRSNKISKQLVDWAELIIVLDPDNYKSMKNMFPQAMYKTTMLGLFLPQQIISIDDPYGMNQIDAHCIIKKILYSVERLIEWINSNG